MYANHVISRDLADYGAGTDPSAGITKLVSRAISYPCSYLDLFISNSRTHSCARPCFALSVCSDSATFLHRGRLANQCISK